MFREFFCARDRRTLLVAWGGAVLVLAHAGVHAWVRWRQNSWFGTFYSLLQTSATLAANVSTPVERWNVAKRDVAAGLWEFWSFAAVAVVSMPCFRFVRSYWTLKWRLSLMRSYVEAQDPNKEPCEGASQRVHEDTQRFSKGVELCLSTGLDSFLNLMVFCPVLGNLGHKALCPRSAGVFCAVGDGWLVSIAVTTAVCGFLVTVLIGRRLIRLEIFNQKAEAALRRSLVLLETQPALVCTSVVTPSDIGGDEALQTPHLMAPTPHFRSLFSDIFANYLSLFCNFCYVNLWLSLYEQIATLLPYILMAQLLFEPDPENRILLGVLVQTSSAFGNVFGSLNVIADGWPALNEFFSVIVRLRQFERFVFRGIPHPTRPGTGTRHSTRAVPFGELQEVPAEISMVELGPDREVDRDAI